jgi:hypothetical protein
VARDKRVEFLFRKHVSQNQEDAGSRSQMRQPAVCRR